MNRLRELDPLYDSANNEQGTIAEYCLFYGLVISCVIGTIYLLTKF